MEEEPSFIDSAGNQRKMVISLSILHSSALRLIGLYHYGDSWSIDFQ